MAKKKPPKRKSGKETEPNEPKTDSVEKPTPSIADARRLFTASDLAEKDLASAEKAVKLAQEKLSKAIQAISETLGNGPFRWKDRVLSISNRGGTFFYKGERQKNITTIG